MDNCNLVTELSVYTSEIKHTALNYLLSYAGNGLYVLYFLQVVADGIDFVHIVYVNPECAFKYTVVALDMYLLYIGVQLLVYYCCYFMQYRYR